MSDRRVQPPWNQLDPEIRPVVRVFFDEGLDPINSCQGHSREDPWIIFLPAEPGGFDGAITTMTDVKRVLVDHKWFVHAQVSIQSVFEAEGDSFGERWWVEVRWWGLVPFRNVPSLDN